MMVDKKTREFVDQITDGDNVAAGETFTNLMKDKQLDAIELTRVETQREWVNQQDKHAAE